MKQIQMVAGLQLFLAVALMVAAFQIDPGVPKISEQAAGNCHQLSVTLQQISKTYAMGIQQLTPFKSALDKFSIGTRNLARQVDDLGSVIRKLPGERFEPTAHALFRYAEGMNDLSDTLVGVKKVLNQFESVDYPQTICCINEAANSLRQAESILHRTASDSPKYIALVIFTICIIFILNAVALFAISNQKKQ